MSFPRRQHIRPRKSHIMNASYIYQKLFLEKTQQIMPPKVSGKLPRRLRNFYLRNLKDQEDSATMIAIKRDLSDLRDLFTVNYRK